MTSGGEGIKIWWGSRVYWGGIFPGGGGMSEFLGGGGDWGPPPPPMPPSPSWENPVYIQPSMHALLLNLMVFFYIYSRILQGSQALIFATVFASKVEFYGYFLF